MIRLKNDSSQSSLVILIDPNSPLKGDFMIFVTPDMRHKIAPLFKNEPSKILKGYLDGLVGQAWVDDLEAPTVAQVKVDIFVFYAGDVTHQCATDLLNHLDEHSLIITRENAWKEAIEKHYPDSHEKFTRYSFYETPNRFNKEQLENYIAHLPSDHKIIPIDCEATKIEALDALLPGYGKSFDSIEDYLLRGFGFYITHNDNIVSFVSTYSIYKSGVEIDIATDPAHEGKGYATVCAAVMMLECFKRGLHPNWDAANETSLHLASKLGYQLNEAYDTYYVHNASNED